MNIAVAALIIASLLPIACAAIAKWGFRGYDNHTPREWLALQTGFRARANAAQANSWEALAVFAPATVLAIATGAPEASVARLAAVFIVARVFFIVSYLTDRPTLRSVAWLFGFAASIWLYALAFS